MSPEGLSWSRHVLHRRGAYENMTHTKVIHSIYLQPVYRTQERVQRLRQALARLWRRWWVLEALQVCLAHRASRKETWPLGAVTWCAFLLGRRQHRMTQELLNGE